MKVVAYHDIDNEVSSESLQVTIVILYTCDLRMHMARYEKHEPHNARSGVN